ELQDRLESLGYTIVGTAALGAEAIELAGQTQPDLVLMDIRLKGAMDGIEAAAEIWERFD
ncbi:MAG: response regulator, partial [Burkholderiales bacterium]|nr:response regulator [Burkholderiales bacterium]